MMCVSLHIFLYLHYGGAIFYWTHFAQCGDAINLQDCVLYSVYWPEEKSKAFCGAEICIFSSFMSCYSSCDPSNLY